jgi:hypothetical protein
VSFKPSWLAPKPQLQPREFDHRVANSYSNNDVGGGFQGGGATGSNAKGAFEDISEENGDLDAYDPDNTGGSNMGTIEHTGGGGGGSGERYTGYAAGGVSAQNQRVDHQVTQQSGAHQYQQACDDGSPALHRAPGSGGGIPVGGQNGKGLTAKAKPGSLRAKLQKLFRDTDALENRVINIPFVHDGGGTKLGSGSGSGSSSSCSGSSARVTDLQDPRSRALFYVDCEVADVLDDAAPFRVVQLNVLHTWRKSSASSSDSNTSSTEQKSTSISKEESLSLIAELEIGCAVIGYFKPDTCFGPARSLRTGLVLRVYDPQFVPCPQHFDKTVKATTDLCMISTHCWEPVKSNF